MTKFIDQRLTSIHRSQPEPKFPDRSHKVLLFFFFQNESRHLSKEFCLTPSWLEALEMVSRLEELETINGLEALEIVNKLKLINRLEALEKIEVRNIRNNKQIGRIKNKY